MKRVLLKFFLVAVVICVSGCLEKQSSTVPPSKASIEGIKFEDLRPSVGNVKTEPEIRFRILTYYVPVENLESLDEALESMIKRPLDFNNYGVFRANGFRAGFGRSEMWDWTVDILGQAEAVQPMTKTLVVFDESGDDIFSTMLETEQSLFYTGHDGSVVTTSFLPGQLAWRLKARPFERIRGLAHVELQPIFRRGRADMLSRLTGRGGEDERIFRFARFEVKMVRGDFILLGSTLYQEDELSLNNFLFSVPWERPMVRFYLIVCGGIVQ